MTRKNYVALAKALRIAKLQHVEDGNAWVRCVDNIGDVLAADNSRFDRERFVSHE